MTLIEALAHRSPTPITIVSRFEFGRQFRWCNGHIQTKPANSKYWHRITKLGAWLLENAEVNDTEIL